MNKRSAAKSSFTGKAEGAAARGRSIQANIDRLEAGRKKNAKSDSAMQVGQAKFGMQTFNQSLAMLLTKRIITQDEAFGRSSDPDELKSILASGAVGSVLPGHTAPPVTGRPLPSRS